MCDHPIEQAKQCAPGNVFIGRLPFCGHVVAIGDGDSTYKNFADVGYRVEEMERGAGVDLIRESSELHQQTCMNVAWLRERIQADARDYTKLHSELVRLRLAYAAIEAERNRLASENRQLHMDVSRLTELAGLQKMSKIPKPPTDTRVQLIHLPRYRADCGHRFTDEASAVFQQRDMYWECRNLDMQEEEFTQAHEKTPDLCIHCPRWESKK